MSAELIGTLGVGATLAVLIWRVYANQDRKIDTLAASHNALAREFSELRGEIKARFSMQDKKQSQEVIDLAAKRVLEGMSND